MRYWNIDMLGDSRTFLQPLQVNATPFNEWFANRIGELYDCMRYLTASPKVIWGWVRPEDNGVDIPSRTDAVPIHLLEGSDWQGGKTYLKLTDYDWPIRKDIMEEQRELPKDEMKKQYKKMAFQQKHVNRQGEGEVHVLDRIALGTNK